MTKKSFPIIATNAARRISVLVEKRKFKSDPRKAKTLGEACDNGDGTYNGFRLLSWLSTLHGPGVSEDEVKRLWEETKQRKKR